MKSQESFFPIDEDIDSLPREAADYPALLLSNAKTQEGSNSIPASSGEVAVQQTDKNPSIPTDPISERKEPLDGNTAIAILLRDGLDQPIVDLAVKIDVPGAPSIQTKTDERGSVTLPLSGDSDAQITLSVKDESGEHQAVCKIDPAKCKGGAAVIRSPKVAAKVPLKPHHSKKAAPASSTNDVKPTPIDSIKTEPAPSTKEANHGAWYAMSDVFSKAWEWLSKESHPADNRPLQENSGKDAHVVKQTVNKTGNPIMAIVGPECPNKENLVLGHNNVYRAELIKAAQRVGLIPQAIAALIDSEAAKMTEVFPVKNADGTVKLVMKGKNKGQPVVTKVKEKWDEKSFNAQSRAAGLTQFLESTWLAHALKPGYFIHEQCISKGWVKQVNSKKGKAEQVFILSNGATSSTPWKCLDDANVKACLDQRLCAEWAIMAAADYGKANLKVLTDAGFKITGLNDGEKAKLMYLLHHEGEGNGPLFIANKLGQMPKAKFASAQARLKNVFDQQVGKVKADELVELAGNDVEKAYRIWLTKYIDEKFDLRRFHCDQGKSPIPALAFDLFKKIGGEGK